MRDRRTRADRRRRGRAADCWRDVRAARAPRAGLARAFTSTAASASASSGCASSTCDTGDQPIYNEDGSVVVVLNGEIYNFRELRERAARARPPLRAPQGDTEVIVHLYEEHGDRLRRARCAGCSRSRSGTRAARRLLLARDRVGKKPLFYCAARRRAQLRLGAARRCSQDPDDPARASTTTRSTRYLRLPVRPGAASAPSRRAQAAAGAHAGPGEDGERRRSSATGGSTTRRKRDVDEPRELREQIRDALLEADAPAA